jgi:hypothetical protein
MMIFFILACRRMISFKNKAKIYLKSKFIELWRDQMLQQTNGKLRTYITFKSNFGREKYLSVLALFLKLLNFIQNWSKFLISGIWSKIVWIEVVLDSKSVLDVIYAS